MQLVSSVTCISVKVASFDSSEQIIIMASECTEGDFLLVGDQLCSLLCGGVLETPILSCSNELDIFKGPQKHSLYAWYHVLYCKGDHNTSVFPGAPEVPAACMGTSASVSTPQSSQELLGPPAACLGTSASICGFFSEIHSLFPTFWPLTQNCLWILF